MEPVDMIALVDSVVSLAILVIWIRSERNEKIWYRNRMYDTHMSENETDGN